MSNIETFPRKIDPQTSSAAVALPTIAEVCRAPNKFLGRLDIAALNLMCAGGLPHAENIDVVRMLDWLDRAAERVEYETRRHWYRFLEAPARYHKSPGYFCCHHLLQPLQEDFGVRYNPERIVEKGLEGPDRLRADFSDSRDLFIHGIIDGPGGTCASMPVVYVAVGRRLGYPLKLVGTRGHLFFRWDDPTGELRGLPERFNIEGTGFGISTYPDEFYETWPEPWSDAEKAGGWHLKSFSPAEELADFLASRGECLADNGRVDGAIQAYEWACGLAPNDLRYRSQLAKYFRRKHEAILAREEIRSLEMEARRERAKHQGVDGGRTSNVPAPPHGDYCQCFHCKQARQIAARIDGAPGHPPDCFCVRCEHKGSGNADSRNGHAPRCPCAQCHRARNPQTNQTNPFHPW